MRLRRRSGRRRRRLRRRRSSPRSSKRADRRRRGRRLCQGGRGVDNARGRREEEEARRDDGVGHAARVGGGGGRPELAAARAAVLRLRAPDVRGRRLLAERVDLGERRRAVRPRRRLWPRCCRSDGRRADAVPARICLVRPRQRSLRVRSHGLLRIGRRPRGGGALPFAAPCGRPLADGILRRRTARTADGTPLVRHGHGRRPAGAQGAHRASLVLLVGVGPCRHSRRRPARGRRAAAARPRVRAHPPRLPPLGRPAAAPLCLRPRPARLPHRGERRRRPHRPCLWRRAPLRRDARAAERRFDRRLYRLRRGGAMARGADRGAGRLRVGGGDALVLAVG